MMPQPTFKFSSSTIAILNDNAQPRVVTIEAKFLVTLVDGDAEGNGFKIPLPWVGPVMSKSVVRIEFYRMFAVDLRTRGERVFEQMA
jgi:hypothetical protein